MKKDGKTETGCPLYQWIVRDEKLRRQSPVLSAYLKDCALA